MASIHQSNLQSNLNLYSSIDLSDSALSNRTDTSTAATSTTQSHSSASLLLDDNSGHFLDCNGRVINLRGINIGGASKQSVLYSGEKQEKERDCNVLISSSYSTSSKPISISLPYSSYQAIKARWSPSSIQKHFPQSQTSLVRRQTFPFARGE